MIKEELAYLEMTAKEHYEQMEQVRERLLELLHYQKNRLAYRKKTKIAVEIVSQLELEGQFKNADYAFDQGVLSRPLTELREVRLNKHPIGLLISFLLLNKLGYFIFWSSLTLFCHSWKI